MIDESAVSKGRLRKLNALRKFLGGTIADDAFAKWLEQAAEAPETNANAGVIADTLYGMIREGRVLIPRGGHVVRRGCKRVIVEPAGE